MKQIVKYYSDYNEDTRLKRHPVEFYTTTFILDKLIKAEDDILDVAAGTGAYAIHYAGKGCSVIAEDIVPKHIEILRKKIPNNSNLDIHCEVSDARDLSRYENETFDVVLCMGPIYHINLEDSEKCLKECFRVLKKNGIIVIGYINKYNGYEKDNYFQQLFFYSTTEIENLVAILGLKKLQHVPVDGKIFNNFAQFIQNKNKSIFEDVHDFLINRSELFTNSDWNKSSVHAVYIGRK